MSAHALLSPSGAERWLNCPPSARLETKFPDNAGVYAEEGTLAHALGELLIRQHLKTVGKIPFQQTFNKIKENELYNEAMQDHAENYAAFVIEQFSDAQAHTSDALIFLEQKLDLTDYVPKGFGTGDAIIIANQVLDMTDLKYGKGVQVSAEENKQLMLYALGALREHDYMYDIKKVRMTIYQPRMDNISSWEITVEDLKKWAEEELRPKAALAFKGQGDYTPGKHCRFCKARAVCKAFAEMNLELAQYEFNDGNLLKDEDIADILNRADTFIKWLNSIEEHALHEAVHNNKKWPGYKLVEGRSNRQYANKEEVAKKLVAEGFKEETIYTKDLLGITAMEKAIGKGIFQTHLGDLIIKPPGKPTLVPQSDKRPEYNSAENAKNDFATI